jgi:CRP-like cAMP-binding protein
MENEIIKYLSKYVPVSKEMEAAIMGSALIKTYKKGTILLKEGAFSNENFLILKGCIRSYYLIDGIEKTTAFYTENHALTPLSYGKNTPSDYYLECTEDTIASVGTPSMETEMLKKHPELEFVFQSACRVVGDISFAKHQELFNNYIISSLEDRYLNLLSTRPDLFQRVHQRHIASYLGITPESFSRLRKRVLKKTLLTHRQELCG